MGGYWGGYDAEYFAVCRFSYSGEAGARAGWKVPYSGFNFGVYNS